MESTLKTRVTRLTCISFSYLYFSFFCMVIHFSFFVLYISFPFPMNIRLIFLLIVFCFLISLFLLFASLCVPVSKLIIKERKVATTHICRILFISFTMLFFLNELVMYAYNTIIDDLVKYVCLILFSSITILHESFSIRRLLYRYKYIFLSDPLI